MHSALPQKGPRGPRGPWSSHAEIAVLPTTNSRGCTAVKYCQTMDCSLFLANSASCEGRCTFVPDSLSVVYSVVFKIEECSQPQNITKLSGQFLDL